MPVCRVNLTGMREKRASGFPTRSDTTGLYSLRIRLEAQNFGFKKKRDCIVLEVKTKVLIRCAVTA